MVVELGKAYIIKSFHGERELNSIRCETFDIERNFGIRMCASKGWRK
jgi:hypothetical protein